MPRPAARRDRIGVNATVPAVAAASVPAVLARFDGCRTAKVKVAEAGQVLADEVARVRAVREAMNEHVTGAPWPPKEHRNARLDESIDVMRRLLAGEEVSHDGAVRVHRARVWSLPQSPPPLFGAAVSPETAEWLAGRVDGLATVAQSPDALRRVVEAYRSAGGEGPCVLQVHLSLAETDAASRRPP